MMTDSSRSSSPEGDGVDPTAWDRLHPSIQRWIWKQKWTELRDVQGRAIAPILEGRDVILAAPTAGGKTEAAFLPIASAIADDSAGSFRVLYLGPLKALINDQCERLESLCGAAGIEVHKRHGDASMVKKSTALKNPSGVLLTTPESLEALLIIHGSRIPSLFAGLAYCVIDELHAFIGEERGRQLQSQIHRIELAIRRRVPRVGLSATLGDMRIAAEALRPGRGDQVHIIEGAPEGSELQIIVRGYENKYQARIDGGEDENGDLVDIAADIYRRFRGTDNLVFANSRRNIERLSDLLRGYSERDGAKNEFYPHHGGLAKELRQDVERDLKSDRGPVTAVCTSTLEMGIDIGAVAQVAQVDPPPSVAALKQRVGRSGRRSGQPQILRGYVQEDELRPESPLRSRLRLRTFQFCAMVDLMIDRWSEPPRKGIFHLSTLVQQTLSTLAQIGGARADEVWSALCQKGPFGEVSEADFIQFLRGLGRSELIRQLHDGSLFLDLKGERLVEHYDFYAAFKSGEEWRLLANGKTLGSTPINTPMVVGYHLLFAGKRWQIVHVDQEKRVVGLVPSRGRRDSIGTLDCPLIHDRVRLRMRELYLLGDLPSYLDTQGQGFVREGRTEFMHKELFERSIIREGKGVALVVWRGSIVVNTIVLLLRREGLEADFACDNLIEIVGADASEAAQAVEKIVKRKPCEAVELAAQVENLIKEKFDHYVAKDLLLKDYASRMIDIDGARSALEVIVEG